MSQRTERVSKLARHALGELIQTLKDPRIGFATVTAVRVSADLRHARVFVSVFGDVDQQAATMAGLESAKPYLRAELGRRIRTKYTPELTFQLDHGPEEAAHLEEVIKTIHEAEESR